MKNTIFTFIVAILCCGAFVGCESGSVDVHEYYKDFLWEKCVPDTLTKTLTIEADGVNQPIKLQLVRVGVDSGAYSSIGKEVELYANGKLCQNHVVAINPRDKEIPLGIVFTAEAEEGEYTWCFKVLDKGDVDCINDDYEIADTYLSAMPMSAKLVHKTNPLLTVMMLILLVIVILLLVWFLLLRRMIFPVFHFSLMQAVYYNGENKSGGEQINLDNIRMIICSSSPKEQSWLNKVFCGRIVYLTNTFWENTVIIKPCDSDSMSVSEELNLDANSRATYQMGGLITAQNGPRKPFVVKRAGRECSASITVG